MLPSRKGSALDSAPIEGFFHMLKTELVHHRAYATRDQARRDLFAYVEGFYNRAGCTRAWATERPPRLSGEQ